VAFLNQYQEFFEHGSCTFDLGVRALQRHLVTARHETDLGEMVLDLTQMAVGLSEEIQHQVMAGDA
jgi:hypothetical protein